jgi:hypothetical protein
MIGHAVIGDEAQEVRRLLYEYVSCLTFSLKDLGQLKGQEVRIILENDHLIFKQPYVLSEVEKALVQAQTI